MTSLAGGLRPLQESVVVLCACGCGTPVTVAQWANRKQGVEAGQARQFAHGHNRRVAMDAPNPSGMCMCGCDKRTGLAVRTNRKTGTVAGQHAQYVKGHARVRPHRLLSLDAVERTAVCATCGPDTVIVTQGKNRPGVSQETRWACRNNVREQMLRRSYNITVGQYREMLEAQDFLCASCRRVEHDWDRPLHVDHNHETGAIVALLCGRCNTAAGLLFENPALIAALLSYVEKKVSTR